MNAQAIQTATIEVKSANPPPEGKKQGTVRATDGAIYGVWPKDLGRFQPGRRYRIEYAVRPYQGRDYRTIIKAEPEAATGEQTHQRASVAAGATCELEFVTRMLAAYVSACRVECTVSALAAKARELRSVYREVWGG
jgi:hypothetical protein